METKIQEKKVVIENYISSGRFYEAHQLVKSFQFRLITKNYINEGIDFISYTCLLFIECHQEEIAIDLCKLLLNLFNSHPTIGYFSSKFGRICEILTTTKLTHPEWDGVIIEIAKWIKLNGTARDLSFFHYTMAQSYIENSQFASGRKHLIGIREYESLRDLLVKFSMKGLYQNEHDLFLLQFILQLIKKKNIELAEKLFDGYVSVHPLFKDNRNFPFSLPILNFIKLIIIAIKENSQRKMSVLVELYKPCLSLDPYNYRQSMELFGRNSLNNNTSNTSNPPQSSNQTSNSGGFSSIISQVFNSFMSSSSGGNSQNNSPYNSSSNLD